MSEMVISTGLSDSQLYLQAVANVGAPYQVDAHSGQYPLVGNVMVNRRLANRWLVTNLASRAFVDGLGVTSAGAESENVGMLRIPLMYMPPRIKRTLASKMCPSDDGLNGTPGNNLPFNRNLPHGVQTDGYDLKFMQEYDEAAQVSRVNMRMIGNDLDLLGQYTGNVPKTVGFLQDADILATHIGAALAYANENANRNIIPYVSSTTTQGYLQSIMNALASALSNVRGSYKEGIISYPRENVFSSTGTSTIRASVCSVRTSTGGISAFTSRFCPMKCSTPPPRLSTSLPHSTRSGTKSLGISPTRRATCSVCRQRLPTSTNLRPRLSGT